MEDLTSISIDDYIIVYPYELVNREFFGFIEKTSFIKEN